MREPLSQPAAPGCALLRVLATNRPPRHVQRSLAARGRRRQEARASPTTCAVTREGEWCGYLGRWPGWAGERGSSALTIGAVGAAAAVVIWSSICSCCTRLAGERRRSCPFSDLQLEREQLSRNGLHGPMANRELRGTMEPDLRGRTARSLHSRNKAMSDTNREELSDLGHLGLDHA